MSPANENTKCWFCRYLSVSPRHTSLSLEISITQFPISNYVNSSSPGSVSPCHKGATWRATSGHRPATSEKRPSFAPCRPKLPEARPGPSRRAGLLLPLLLLLLNRTSEIGLCGRRPRSPRQSYIRKSGIHFGAEFLNNYRGISIQLIATAGVKNYSTKRPPGLFSTIRIPTQNAEPGNHCSPSPAGATLKREPVSRSGRR